MKDENIIKFKPVQPQEEEQEQPRDLLKEFGSFDNLPDGELFALSDVLNMLETVEVKDVFLVFEHMGKDRFEKVQLADTEFDAFNKYRNIKHTDKAIYKSDVVYKKVMGERLIDSYKLHERIK